MKFTISNMTYSIFAKKGLELLKIQLLKGKKDCGCLFYKTLIQKKVRSKLSLRYLSISMCAVTGQFCRWILLYGLLNLKSLVKVWLQLVSFPVCLINTKYLANLAFSVRTVSYRSWFFPLIYGPCAWAINQQEKTLSVT